MYRKVFGQARKNRILTTTPPENGGLGTQRAAHRRSSELYRPLAKIAASSCGGTTSSCAYEQSLGFLSGRQQRKCAMCRKRLPCMCSYATSTTSSGRKGSQERSLP